MTAENFLFWFLAALTLFSGLSVILVSNPVYSALCLAMAMIGVSAIFVTLGAYFIAGVQLIVYAGAVMVLFVMVLMLFDLKAELQAFTRGRVTGAIKIASVGIIAGLVVGALTMGAGWIAATPADQSLLKTDPVKVLSVLLFTKNTFIFEVLGLLLLVIAVGAVALARSKGGTHAKH